MLVTRLVSLSQHSSEGISDTRWANELALGGGTGGQGRDGQVDAHLTVLLSKHISLLLGIAKVIN